MPFFLIQIPFDETVQGWKRLPDRWFAKKTWVFLKLQSATYEQMSVQRSVQRITSNQLIKGANDQIWLESKRGFGDAEINIYNGNKVMLAANDQQQ